MAELLQAITEHREAILLGEIGAFLHMFGKCSSDFLIANSQENQALPQNQRRRDSHQDLKHLTNNLKTYLEDPRLTDSFVFSLNGQPERLAGNYTDFIQKYSRCTTCNGVNPAQCPRCKGNSPDSLLMWLLNTCHRMTSADEKGVVRRTQSKDDMQITTPFGYRAQKIDLSTVDAVREKMDSNFAKALHGYLRGNAAIDVLHDQAVHILSEGMSQALGETRKPANDVTLWAQSHGVASLYKPVLATLALGLEPCPRKGNGELDYTNVRWRLFGIGWNGLGFVQRGRRPGDILRRQEILQDIRKKLKCLLEVEYPLGNLFYEDLNGLFFTFPGLHDQEVQAEALVKELAPKIVEVVRKQSDMELWPFFTLSRPRRTLTAITTEIRARDSLASLPRVAALLSLETAGSQREEKLLVDGPALEPPTVGEDICPVCQFRSKQQKEDACQVCKDRRSRRQDTWQGARHNQTIWIDEVADDNNRLALLTLRFDLSRWLSGEWLTTLYSQTIDNWASGSEFSALRTAGLTSRIRSFASSQRAPSPDLNNPSPALAMEIATLILKPGNPGVRASLLQSFFVSGEVLVREDQNSPYFVERHLENIAAKFEKDRNSLTPSELVENCFTQNPSPARLRRIWEATESFLTEGICSVGGDTFAASARPRRLHFTITSRLAWAQPRKTYRITIPRLGSVPLTVLCLESEKHCRFLTVDSLEKFHLSSDDRKLHGLPAVQVALESGGISEWLDEETGTTGVAGIPAHQVQGFDSEEYLPLIVLARSPIFCQLLLPAEKASHTLKRVSGLADKHFGKVRGKLPLSTTLLVVNRRFPLYALLDAGQMALDDPSFSEGSVQGLWWDAATHEADSFYGYYPMKKPNEDRGWTLTDLAPVNQVSRFWMTPGYFDFDFLGSTADRHNLIYERRDGRLVRLSIAYGALQPRPFAIHRLKDLLWVWDTLAATQLGPTQRHHVEEALSTKLEEWESVDWEAVRPVFNHFSKALLRQTFPEEKWAELSQEQRGLLERSANDGLLLEALELFQHVLKEESSHG